MQTEQLSLLIIEFYNTTDANVRKNHTTLLNNLQERMLIKFNKIFIKFLFYRIRLVENFNFIIQYQFSSCCAILCCKKFIGYNK